MPRVKTSRKNANRMLGEVNGRVVALSLKNPDLGVRRLVPLLEKEKITVSPSTVYGILKRHGLQNREKRVAKLKGKAAKPATTSKKTPARSPDEVAEQIVALSLQHPDYGVRRLVPLLKDAKILLASPSTIYSILKRYGLQNRENRMAKLKAQARKRKSSQKKAIPKISDEAAARIMALSLQHPDYGAKRLIPLLEADGIRATSSAVYWILRRHGLQNRSLRLLKLKEQQAVEPSCTQITTAPLAAEQPAEIPLDAAEEIQPQAEKPQPVLPLYADADEAPLDRVVPVSKRPAKARIQGAGVLTLFNIVLLALIAYLGFYTVQNLRRAGMEPQAEFIDAAPAASGAEELQAAVSALNDYRMIWERNLFNVSGAEAKATRKEMAVEKLRMAEKDLGLKLVGTVVADDALLRRAFIDNSKTRKQEAYREKDTVGEVRIKKILRNKVVISTREGDRVLTADILDNGRRPATSQSPQQKAKSTSIHQESAEASVDFKLKRSEVESSLADLDKLMEEVRIATYLENDQPAGFMLGGIMGWNILAEMGLRNGDVITGVNGEPFTSPDQAAEFFERLSEGGRVTIDINRRRRPIKVRLDIG